MSFFVRILRWIFRVQRIAYDHRRYSLTLVGIVVVIIGWAYQNVQSSNDPMLFFGEGNEHRQKLAALQEEFGASQQALFVLRADQPGAPLPLLDAERYLSLRLLAEGDEAALPDVINVGSATALLPVLGYPVEYTTLEDVQYLAPEVPALREYYFSEDLSATVLIVSQDLSDQSNAGLAAAYRDQQALLEDVRGRFPGIEVSAAGNISTFEALREAFEYDEKYLFPSTVLVNFVVLLIAFGNLRVTIGVLLIAITAVVMTRGVAGWSGYVFASGTSSSFSIVLTLTVASLIHVVHAIGQRQRHLPFQRSRTVILAAFRKLTVPVLLAHVTTAVGFLSLNWADAPSFQALGNLVAVGLVFSLLLTLFVAPIVFKQTRRELYIHDDRVRKVAMVFARAWAAAPLRAGLLVGVLATAALAGLPRIEFDDQLTKFFPEDHWLRQNIDHIADGIGWSQSFDVVVTFDEGEMVTPEGFDRITGLLDWMAALPHVSKVSGPMPIIEDCLALRTPPYEGPMAEVPPKMLDFCVRSSFTVAEGERPSFFNAGFTKLHVKVLLKKLSSNGIRELAETIEAGAPELGFAPGAVQASGLTVMSAYLSQVNTHHMLIGSGVAMLVVSVLIGLFLRSVVLAFMSILPNFLPAMASLGLWVWINGQVGMAASIIAAITFGIVVDDTIHILYALARGKNTVTRRGVKKVLRNVTPGVLTTTATLGFGFSMLILSGFGFNKQLGFLTGMTIWIAFLFDIFVLPGMYRLLQGHRR